MSDCICDYNSRTGYRMDTICPVHDEQVSRMKSTSRDDIENSSADIDPRLHESVGINPVDGELRRTILGLCERLREHVDLDHPDPDMTRPCQWSVDVAEEIMQLVATRLQAAVREAELKTEIRIHDEYWHSQRLVNENGIGPVALANKEASELELRQLNQTSEGGEG